MTFGLHEANGLVLGTFLELVVKCNSLPRTDEAVEYTKIELEIQSTDFIFVGIF